MIEDARRGMAREDELGELARTAEMEKQVRTAGL